MMDTSCTADVHQPKPDDVEIGGVGPFLWLTIGPVTIHCYGSPDEMLQQARAMRVIAAHAADIADQLTARIAAVDVTEGWGL